MGKEAEQMETSSMAFRNVVQKFHCALIISSIYIFWGGGGGEKLVEVISGKRRRLSSLYL